MSPSVLAAIVAMAAVTYLCRGGGYLLFRLTKPPPLVRTALAYVPGGLFVSYVLPALANGGGLQGWIGAVATAGIMLATRNVTYAVLGGTAAAWAVWSFG